MTWDEMLPRGRWTESLLAMAAAIAVAWPLGDLVAERPWTAPLIATLVLVSVAGSVARTVAAPRWIVLLLQLTAGLTALSWWVRPPAVATEPVSALAAATALVDEGIWTIQTYMVPAPATPGLTFVVLTGMVLVAWLVEAVAVTFRAAALAGVPLLLLSGLSASNTGQPLDPRYFLIAAACWLVLLARQNRSVLEEWRAAGGPVSSSVNRSVTERGNRRRFGFVARSMGLLALVLAVALPGVLPHLPTTSVLDGIGRAGDDEPGSVSFTETLDLAQDLSDRSTTPVIRYRTDASSPPPLRVTVSTDYVDGEWQSQEPSRLSAPLGETGIYTINQMLHEAHELETREVDVTVTQNGLRAPQLAMPHPPSALDLGEIAWDWDPLTDLASVAEAPETYELSYLELASLSTLPDEFGAPAERLVDLHEVVSSERIADGSVMHWGPDDQLLEWVEEDGTRYQWLTDRTLLVREPDGSTRRVLSQLEQTDYTAVDPASADRVSRLAEELAGGRTNTIDIALALQEYLRGSAFAYSLTLADPVEGPDGDPLDPISHFLETKQGYCTQFASVMVMMARSLDIPARLAIGFLPGTAGLDGTRTVVAADAHAWPELFIAGLGWTRFEPTPGSRAGTAPTFATESGQQDVPVPQPDPVPEAPEPGVAVPEQLDGGSAGAEAGWWQQHRQTLGWVALGLATAVLLASVRPLLGWWRREGWRARRGKTPAQRVEREWGTLLARLSDLGVTVPATATPRTAGAQIATQIDPDATTEAALSRVVGRVENARYAAEPAQVGAMREDAAQVVQWYRRQLPRHRKVRTALFPRSALGARGTRAPAATPAAQPAQ